MAKRRNGKPTGTVVVQHRLGRAALLRGTALQAVFGLVFLAPAAAQPAPSARPQGGQVVAGSAAIANTTNATTITQSSNRAAIDWQSFNVGRDQAVNFQQPGATSVTLNRVMGGDPSAIAGRISANGQIVLTNPNGVTFHQGSQVNAQSVIVSTAGISNQNFMAGRMAFDRPGNPNARIDNQGTITVKQAGLAALVAPSVQNSGVINARMGQVILAGAAAHTLDMYGDGLVSIDVTKQVRQAPVGPDGKLVTALVTNTGTILADGGVVQLTASAADGVVQTLVRAGGSIRANTVGNQAGRIEIAGTGGSVVIEGRVAADGRAPGTSGGTVMLSGSEATTVAAGARVSANGRTGGGTVAVGTSLARARTLGPAPAGTSARTTVAAGARISADATGKGNGGRATILSTTTTVVDGATSARGGRQGGDGGTIELSGEQGFRLTGTADTAAPQGRLGTVVLDPRDLLITSTPSGTNVTPSPSSSGSTLAYNSPDTTTDAYVTPSQLSGLSGNVRLQATRDLTVVDSFTITAGQLTLEAGRNLSVNSGATITTQGPMSLSAATIGIPSFDPTGSLTVAGRLNVGNANTGSNLTLSAGTGGISLSGTISSPFSVTVSTPGSLTQTVGSIQTQVLAGTAGTVSLLSTGNAVSGIGSSGYGVFNVTAPGGNFLLSAGNALTVNNVGGTPGITVPTGGLVALQTNALTLTPSGSAGGGTVIAAPGGTLQLAATSAGTPILVTAGAKPANTLAVSPAELATTNATTIALGGGGNTNISFGASGEGTINLTNGPGNLELRTTGQVSQAAPIAVTSLFGKAGSVSLTNTGNVIPTIGTLTSTGPIDIATSGNLSVAGTVTGSDALYLRAGGNLTVPAAGIVTTSENIALQAGYSAIPNYDPAATLTMAGQVKAGFGATFNAGRGGIALSGTVDAPNFGLYTTGAVAQTTGSITTDSLEGTVGSLSLPSTTNVITGIATGGFVQLRATSETGDIAVTTSASLRVGSPSMAGGLFVQSGRQISLTTDSLTIDPSGEARTINAPSGTFVLAPFTPGGSILLTSGTKPATGLALTTADLQQVDANTLQLGTLNGTTPTAGAITFGQTDETIDLGAIGFTNLSLYSRGAVTQGGALGVTRISGIAASLNLPYATENGSNYITYLDGFTATAGDIAVHTSGSLTVSGTLSATGNVTLSSGSVEGNIGMTLTGDIFGKVVSLNSLIGDASFSPGIEQTGGIITADSVTAAGGSISLPSANKVGNLGNFDAYGQALFTTAQPLVLTGSVSSTISDVTLNAAGITQAAGSAISAQQLNGSSSATTLLTSRDNAVSAIGTFQQTAGDFTLVTSSSVLRFNGGSGGLVANAGSFTFVADQVGLGNSVSGGAAIAAASGSVTFAPFTAGRRIELIGNTTPDTASLSVGQPLWSTIGAARLGLGNADSTGTINVANAGEGVNLTGTAATLALRTSGAVTEGVSPGEQNGGGLTRLTVGTVTGTVGSLTLGAPANSIGTITDLVAAQSATLLTSQALTASGTVSANLTTGTLTFSSALGLTTAGTLSGRNIELTASSGTLSLSSGSVTAPGTLKLQAPGQAISQTGAPITAGTLSATAASATLGLAGNSVATLGGVTTTGAFTLTDARSLTVTGPVSAASATLGITGDLAFAGNLTTTGTTTLTVSGAVTQAAGSVLSAGTLTGSAASATLNQANTIATLGAFTTSGAFALNDTRSLTVAGPFTAGSATLAVTGDLAFAGTAATAGTLGLTVSGAVTQSAGTLSAGTLTGTAASAALGASNAVGTLGSFATTGAFALTNGQSLTLAGPVSASTAALTVAGNLVLPGTITTSGTTTLTVAGAITQPGGTITAPTLTGSAASAALGGNNSIATLGAFSTSGAFALADTRSVTVAGPLSAGSAALTVTGDLTLSGTLSVPGTLALAASGIITQTGGGVTAGTLTGSAVSAGFTAGSNAVTTLGAFSTQNGFTLNDTRSLSITGPLSAGTISLGITGDLAFAGTVSTSGNLGVSVSGGITQPSGAITANTFNGNAASAALGGGNSIAVLNGFSTTGAFALTDIRSISVAGPLSAGTASLGVTGDITLFGTVTVPGTLTLAATGAITQPGGTVTAGTLAGGATSAALGAANSIATLAGFATSGSFALNDTRSLTVSGPFTAGSATLAVTGDLAFAGTAATTGTLGLTVSGAVTQSAGTVTAGTLTGTAASAALGNGNAVATLGAFTTTGAFALADARSLTVAGPVSASTASLSATGDLTLSGTVSVPGALTLAATGAITQTAGTVTAATLGGSAGSAVLGAANSIATLAGFGTTGAFVLNDNRSLTVTGPFTASDASLGITGDLALAGRVTVPGSLVLTVSGAITQSADAVTAGVLSGSATSASLGANNGIGTLASFTTSGDFTLGDTTTLTLAGPLSAANIGLRVGGDLVLAGSIGTGGTLGLSVSGGITQPAGAIQATTLTGSASSAAFTQRGNAISTLGAFSSAGDFALVDSVPITVAGAVSAGTGHTLSLTADAPSFARGGTLSAPGGTVALTEYTPGRGLVLGGSGSFDPDGIVIADRLVIGGPTAGPITIAGAFNLSTINVLDLQSGGAIAETGSGALQVATLQGQGASASLGGANQVGTLGRFGTTGAFAFNDTQTLTVTGPLSGASIALSTQADLVLSGSLTTPGTLSLAVGGAITQPGGTIAAATLTGSAASAALGSAANQIATLGRFATTGSFTLNDAASLTVSGPLSAANAGLTTAGTLGLAGTIGVPGTLALSAAGAITQSSGTVTAGTLSGTAASLTLGSSGNAIATLGAVTTTGSLALTDGRSLTISGPVAASAASLSVTGDLVLAGSVTVPDALNLAATGAITQTSGTRTGGILTVGTLFGSAATANLGAANRIGTLGGFATTGAFGLTNAATLAVAGPVTASTASLAVSGDLTLAGPITVPGTLTLTASGAMTQPGGAISAGTLTGSAASATLAGTSNAIATLGRFATTGGFALADASSLAVTGPVSGSSLALSSGADLVLNGTLTTAGALTLTATGAITQTGGSITAATLAGSAASAALGGANQVATLAGFTTSGAFALTDAIALTLGGPVTAGTAALAVTGDLTLAGNLTAGSLALTSSGAITQPGGAILATSLSANAASLTLGAPNRIGRIGALATTGESRITNATGLVVDGPITGSAIGLSVTGDLTLAGSIATPGTATLTASGAITQTGGTLAAGTLTGSSGAATTLAQRGNGIGTLAAFAGAGGFSLADATPLTIAGPVSVGPGRTLTLTNDAPNVASGGSLSAPGGTVALAEYTPGRGITLGGGSDVPAVTAATLSIGSRDAGPIAITGAYNLANVTTLDLQSGGAITESGAGAIQVARLTGQAASATLGGQNRIGTLGGFATTGGFSLNDVQTFSVSGPLAASNITLTSGGDMVLNGTIGTGGTLTLIAAGTISQPGGSITAGALTGQATAASLDRTANSVPTLAGFTTTGDFTFTDARSLVVSAPVDPNVVTLNVDGTLTLNSTVTGGTVVLNATGGIVQGRDGRVVADLLTGRADSAALTAANQVAGLGDFTTRSGFALNTAGALSVAGTVQDQRSVAIGSGGALTLSGVVRAPSVSFRSNGGTTQTGGAIEAGTLALSAAGPITTAGTVTAGTATVTTPGAVTQAGGRLTLGTLSGTTGSLDLGRGGPASIAGITDLSATSTLTLVDQAPLRLSGTLAAPFLAVTATGAMTLDGGTIRTNGQPLGAQTGATPAVPGSTLTVLPGTAGTASLQQLGTTSVIPYDGSTATLRLQLPASGGRLTLNDLQAGAADLVFGIGSGTASGRLAGNNLTVLAAGGRAELTGELRQRGGTLAAQFARVLPQPSDLFTLNGCALQGFSCTPDTSQLLLGSLAAIASTLRPDILTLDVLDLTVTRDRDDPTLLLPNISERDY